MSNIDKENLLEELFPEDQFSESISYYKSIIMWDDIDDESKKMLEKHVDEILAILKKHNLTENDYDDLIQKRYNLEIEKMNGDISEFVYECGCCRCCGCSCDE